MVAVDRVMLGMCNNFLYSEYMHILHLCVVLCLVESSMSHAWYGVYGMYIDFRMRRERSVLVYNTPFPSSLGPTDSFYLGIPS